MGIPHLAQLLQPYAETTVLGCKTRQCEKHQINAISPNVIIDGPALAYHIYHKLHRQKHDISNAFDTQPSYKAIGSAIIRYLDELQSYNLQMYVMSMDQNACAK